MSNILVVTEDDDDEEEKKTQLNLFQYIHSIHDRGQYTWLGHT